MTASSDGHADPLPDCGGAFTYVGGVHWEYSPELDGEPDPGEIVWSWVSYEEDESQGKDRPVAVVGRAHDQRLIAVMLSSRDHSGQDDWISIGSGPWDPAGRESWVRCNRLLAVSSTSVRREGSVIPRDTYVVIVQTLTALRERLS